jgi:probable phosphomutase (TIGR03848 family)
VRHGRTPTTGKELPGHAGGLHLADEGRAQAERAAERIAALARRPVAIYASPLDRTRETAAPIAKALGLRVRTEHGLIDSDPGEWTGARLSRVTKKPEWGLVSRWPSGFRFPGGESFAEVSARANDTLVSLVAAHRGETFVAVSHADTIKLMVASAAGVPLDLFQRLVISPCSISAIAYGPAGPPTLLCVNSTASLSELAPS